MNTYRWPISCSVIVAAIALCALVEAREPLAPLRSSTSFSGSVAGENKAGPSKDYAHESAEQTARACALEDFQPWIETDSPSGVPANTGAASRLNRDAHIAQSLFNSGLTSQAIQVLNRVVQEAATLDLPQRAFYEAQLNRLVGDAQSRGISSDAEISTATAGDRPAAMLLLPVNSQPAGQETDDSTVPASVHDAGSLWVRSEEGVPVRHEESSWPRRRALFRKVLGSATETQHESMPLLTARSSGESSEKPQPQRARAMTPATSGPRITGPFADRAQTRSFQSPVTQAGFESMAPNSEPVWVIGSARQPGRYDLSTSTGTLGKLLYRAGGVDEAEADGDVVIVEPCSPQDRAVGVAAQNQAPACTLLNLYARTRQCLQSPIRGGALVLVRPRHETLVYVAIMPHWVMGLQPSDRALTADQVVDALGHVWPQLDPSRAGLLCTRVSDQILLLGHDISWDAELRPGDVLCFDGDGFDPDLKRAAFQSLRRVTGCPVKNLCTSPSPASPTDTRRASM